MTRTDTPLTIEGVSIVARYAGMPKEVPLIEVGGNLTLERCAFTATGAVKGSRAVASEGGSLTVHGCWFDGFDTALDVAAFAGSATTIKQSMMVRAKTDAQPIGWAVRIRRTPGGSSKVARRLLMEHCTVKGKGLLHLADFSPESPLHVDIKECATMADAALAWETPKPGTPLTAEALAWKGEGNQYDIHGTAWVVLSPEGTPELPDGPADLASWRSKMNEHDPLPPPIRFRVPPESLSETPQPSDFGLIDQDARSPGADPSRVGPSAPPER
jgi:serine/threonine-protein kinase